MYGNLHVIIWGFPEMGVGTQNGSFGRETPSISGGFGGSPIFRKLHIGHMLVGGWATPLKNMNVNWDDYSQY